MSTMREQIEAELCRCESQLIAQQERRMRRDNVPEAFREALLDQQRLEMDEMHDDLVAQWLKQVRATVMHWRQGAGISFENTPRGNLRCSHSQIFFCRRIGPVWYLYLAQRKLH
jgi:hypothetical protein